MMSGDGSKKKRRTSRRHGDQLAAAAQDLHLRIAQDAETAALDRRQVAGLRVARELELACAQEGEVGLLQPLQERDGLAQHLWRKARVRQLQLLSSSLEALQHGPPIGDHDAHLGEDVGDGRHQIARFGLRQHAQVDGDVAFLVAVAPIPVAGSGDGLQVPGLVALGLEDRVEQEAYGDAAGLQLGQNRIDEERHVVVEDLDDRAFRHRTLAAGRRASGAKFVPSPRLVGDELQGLACIGGKPVGRQAFEPALAIAGVEQRSEQGGRRSLSQCLLHLADETACRGFDVESHLCSLPWRAKRQVVDLPASIDNACDRPLTIL